MLPRETTGCHQDAENSGALPDKTYIGRRTALVLAALLCFGLAAGGLFLLWETADGLITAYQATSWQQTECTLQESSIRQSRGRRSRTTYSLHICYAYSYQGKSYQGTTYAPYPPARQNKAELEAIRQRLLEQNRCTATSTPGIPPKASSRPK